jgi:hypothetical protein
MYFRGHETHPLFYPCATTLLIVTDQTGIRHYDVQVSENDGAWDDWLTAVDYTGATFVGTLLAISNDQLSINKSWAAGGMNMTGQEE